jgi:hypothetical protein
MPPSERQIESAIDSLKTSPGTFQALVERYARLSYPHRFNHIVPLGRNPNNVTVRGWPDVYSLAEDFRLCVAEATHSPDWPKHLESDIEKAEALGKGRFSSFLFVAWDNEPSPLTNLQKINPRYKRLEYFRDRLVALGIPPDSISFVFKKQLIHTLRQPRFAAVLKEILGLSFHSLPFRLIRESPLFGRPGRAETFAPAEKEYLEGLVHRATLAGKVEHRLSQRGWAWIRGRGATGKTVLAIQIALDYEGSSYPAYYLNLAETELDIAKTLDSITTSADEQVLFIIDNVHLNEVFARDIFNHWRQDSLGSRLLLLGRDVTVVDVRGTANPLQDLQTDSLTLTVNTADLAGVFHRLARRSLATSTVCPTPSATALERWEYLFGGDLIAFSAAVARKIMQLTQGDWLLQPQDAANYVHEIYLAKASQEERLNLLRMAVLAQLEIDVPAEAINRIRIKRWLHGGLVHQVGRGVDSNYEYYHLIHPGLGDLLLEAADYSSEELDRFVSEQFCFVAQHNPFVGLQIASRLEFANRAPEAIEVLLSLIESDSGITSLLTSGARHLRRNCERLARLGVLSEEEVDQRLAKEVLVLCEAALRTPLGDLVTFLDYAERKLRTTYTGLQTELAKRKNLATLTQTALRTPLHFLVTFLDYAERKLGTTGSTLQAELAKPENLATLSQTVLRTALGDLVTFLDYAERKLGTTGSTLQTELAKPENLVTLTQTALRTPLHFLVTFLDYAERKLGTTGSTLQTELAKPENLATLIQTALRTQLHFLVTFLDYAERKLGTTGSTLRTELAKPENLATLTQTALRTALGDLVTFLDYAERKLGATFTALQAELAKPENLATLTQTALHSPLHLLVTFLDYAERNLLGLGQSLVAILVEEKSIRILARTACQEPLNNLLRFFRTAKIAPMVVAAIDRDEWDRSRFANRAEQPYFFHGLAKELQRLGRPELAETPARMLINTPDVEDWHAPGIGLTQLSQVMRLGHVAGHESVRSFLDKIVTPAWLQQRYNIASTGSIAAALFGLWGTYEQIVLDHFCVEALSLRLAAEMKRLQAMNPEFLSAALQLLGTSALVGVRTDKIPVNWPHVQQVHEAVRFAAPHAGMTTIGYIQIQLWLGLREMAHLRPDPLTLDPLGGEQILRLWRNSKGYNNKQETLNAYMIDWLEQCAVSNWILRPDSVRLNLLHTSSDR